MLLVTTYWHKYLAVGSLPSECEHHDKEEVHNTTSHLSGVDTRDNHGAEGAGEHEEDPDAEEDCDTSRVD